LPPAKLLLVFRWHEASAFSVDRVKELGATWTSWGNEAAATVQLHSLLANLTATSLAKDYPEEKSYRDVKLCTIGEGAGFFSLVVPSVP
jgi:hypothetical protein